jgi:subtilisin family serine protease
MVDDALTVLARAELGRKPESALRLVGLLELMNMSAGNPDLIVALIDGPVDVHHPDLVSENMRVLPGRIGATCTSPESVACNHGTYVAGILHAQRHSAAPGICHGCRLLVRPIFSETAVPEIDGIPNATMDELAAAIVEVMDFGARVINLSIGLGEPSSRSYHLMNEALEQAALRGVIIVAAAGNQATLGSSAITRHRWVIPVAACDRNGRVLGTSNIGASISRNGCMAPGEQISSLAASGGYTTLNGTSAAVPFVSGAVALLWSVFPKASAAQLRLAIAGRLDRRRSVTPPLLSALAAYQALKAIGLGVRA